MCSYLWGNWCASGLGDVFSPPTTDFLFDFFYARAAALCQFFWLPKSPPWFTSSPFTFYLYLYLHFASDGINVINSNRPPPSPPHMAQITPRFIFIFFSFRFCVSDSLSCSSIYAKRSVSVCNAASYRYHPNIRKWMRNYWRKTMIRMRVRLPSIVTIIPMASNRNICWSYRRKSPRKYWAHVCRRTKCKNYRYVRAGVCGWAHGGGGERRKDRIEIDWNGFFRFCHFAIRWMNFDWFLFFFFCKFLLQAKINHEILNSKVFSLEHQYGKKQTTSRIKSSATSKARTMMNLHNNEAGRRVSFQNLQITILL